MQCRLLVGQMLQRSGRGRFAAELDATAVRQRLRISHCRPEGREVVRVDQDGSGVTEVVQVALCIKRCHAA